MTYKDGYDKIINKYAELKEEIEAKEITETYTAEMKAEELAENEEAKKKELEQYDADYVKAMEDIKNTQPVDYIYIETKIENIDFVAPEPIDLETANLEKVMTALPETIYNTKYIYLTLDNKYEAIKKLEDEEYAKYEESFNNVVSVYKTQANEINNKYDDLKAQIEAKQITETYTAEMKAEELAENEEARDNELKINEDSKAEEIKLVNNDYAVNSSKIAIALTQLKSDKETGFIGDVHIHGKLHVDTNVNIEGNINNVPVSDYLTKVDKIELTQLLDNKANTSHTHNIEDITDYEPYDDTEIRTLINSKSDNSHTHTNFNKVNITNSAGPTKWNYDIVAIKPNMEEGNYNLFYIGKTREKYISGYFGYRHSESDPRMTIGIHSADDLLTIGITQANIKPALTCDNTITATNITVDNETRLKTVESYKNIIDNVKLRQDERFNIYGIETFNTGTGTITQANITTNLSVSGMITADKIETTDVGENLKNTLLNMFYPIGAIYTSMNNTNPASLFGGEWEQITDRFLYCANSSKETGGSKKISVNQLPTHSHGFMNKWQMADDINGYPDGWDDTNEEGGYWRYGLKHVYEQDATWDTGNGEDYMPPYITVYAWYRIA